MKVIIRESAEADLDQIAEWIAQDSPDAAARMVATIRDRINFLETDELAHMGRPGLVEGTRELLEYPYIIIYQVHDERREVVVLSIVHGARDREREER
jgi:plasmid stabilization system protein ParE